MKLTDSLIKKFGQDKLLHFVVAGWLTQIATLAGWPYALVTMIIIVVLSYFKEVRWDNTCDFKDLYAALLGCLIAFLLQILL